MPAYEASSYVIRVAFFDSISIASRRGDDGDAGQGAVGDEWRVIVGEQLGERAGLLTAGGPRHARSSGGGGSIEMVRPNKSLQEIGHATDGVSWRKVVFRVSRPLSCFVRPTVCMWGVALCARPV